MKTKISTLPLFLLILMLPATALKGQNQSQGIPPWNRSPVRTQFDYLIFRSAQETNYRLVDQNWLFILKSRVMDTLNMYKHHVDTLQNLSTQRKNRIDSLQTALDKVKAKLQNVNMQKQSILFFGVRIDKGSYKAIIWTVIIALIISLLIMVALYYRSNAVTVETVKSHEELKEEFEAFRKRTLHREEELARKYLNEINKYKK